MRPHLLEHVQRFAGVQQRKVLRRGNDNGTSDFRLLGQRHLNIARTGWQIDDQHVQLSPLDLCQHLLQRAHQHRTAPDNGLVLARHQTNRHQRDAMIPQRQNRLSIG